MKKLSLKEKYEKEIRPVLAKEYGFKSLEAAPRVTKVIVNMGTGDQLKNKEVAKKLMGDMALVTGQKPSVRSSRMSVAGFGIREGNPVGLMVTLRREKMYSFLERLIAVVLPRLRDFRGLSLRSFDGNGNYSIGLSEYVVFPEIDLTKVDRSQGMEITVVTNAKSVEKSKRLLELLGMPFEKKEETRRENK
jgi:large subunit ribosomal protein L5